MRLCVRITEQTNFFLEIIEVRRASSFRQLIFPSVTLTYLKSVSFNQFFSFFLLSQLSERIF